LQESGQNIFAPKGFLPEVGTLFKQPELAATLEKIAEEGPDYFYRGPFAVKMVSAIQDIGGRATLEDFASYRPIEHEPIRGRYKQNEIVGASPPATGLTAIIEAMNILEHVDLKAMGDYSESADALQWLIEVFRVITDDAGRYNGVPLFDRELAQLLISKDYAKSQYEILRHKIEVTRRDGSETDPTSALDESVAVDETAVGTNHVSVVDENGNICSITHTIYGATFSTHGLFVDGIVLNSSGGFRAQPGQRIVSSMPASIVFKEGEPYFACGSSGGYPNPFFLMVNVLAYDKNFQEAQEAPRFRVSSGKVRMEHRIQEEVAEALEKRGYQIEWSAPYAMRNAQIAGIDPSTGIRYGAADPRGEGHAAGQ
jgi:gamma-glutamyltranspeptidase/glutathione hydrolase